MCAGRNDTVDVLEGALLLFILVGAFWALAKSERGTKGHDRRRRRPVSGSARSKRPAPFDESSARPLHHSKTLSGPAWITDGDTLTICKTQIRLFGIDAPELNHPYGKKAKWALHGLCKGHSIRAEITEIDHYGRTVARCYLPDGRDLSAEMVRQGLAIDWPKYSGGKYRALEVRDARRKLWLADARQRGRMHVWAKFEARQGNR